MRLRKFHRNILKSFKENLAPLIWGSLFSAFISLIIWLFAFFGYTNLGLPQRFEFEILDNTIRAELPKDYEYNINKVSFRGDGFETLVVVARDKKAYETRSNGVRPDIVLVLDKTSSAYGVTYKFSPAAANSKIDAPLHAVSIQYDDLNGDNRQDLVLGWSYIGANYSPPYITVLSELNGRINLLPVPRLENYEYPEGFREFEIENAYDSRQKALTDTVYTYFVGNGELAIVNREDSSCSACGEEHIYNVNYFRIYGSKLIEIGSPDIDVRGWSALKVLLGKRNFDIER